MGFPGDSDGKESAYNAGDLALILGFGRSLGEGDSCLENSMDREAWWTNSKYAQVYFCQFCSDVEPM